MSVDSAVAGPPSERERLIAQMFVVLAAAGDESDEVLAAFAGACVELFGLWGAGLLTCSPCGGLELATSAPPARALIERQIEQRGGPCLDVLQTGHSLLCDDLATAANRWPAYVEVAVRAGVVSTAVLPVRWRGQTLGALELLRDRKAPMDPGERRLAQELAGAVALSVLRRRERSKWSTMTQQLQRAVNSRVPIEQAKGMVAEYHRITPLAAFEMLRAYSRNHNLRLLDVAESVVGREIEPSFLSTRY